MIGNFIRGGRRYFWGRKLEEKGIFVVFIEE